MSDLVKRLREFTVDKGDHLFQPPECQEAADALDESQAQIDSLQAKVHLCAAYDKLEAFVQKCADVKNDEGWQGAFWKEARQLLAGDTDGDSQK